MTCEKALLNDHRIERRLPRKIDPLRSRNQPTRKIEIAATEGFLSLTWSSSPPGDGDLRQRPLEVVDADCRRMRVPERPRSTAALLASVAEFADDVVS